jgi:hypothetical protein
MIAEIQATSFDDFLEAELAKLDAAENAAAAEREEAASLRRERVVYSARPPVPIPYEAFLRLGFTEEPSIEALEKRFRKLSKTSHPDRGGSPEVFRELAEAKRKCLEYLRGRRGSGRD